MAKQVTKETPRKKSTKKTPQILNDQFCGDTKVDQYAEMKKQREADFTMYHSGFLVGLKQGLHDGFSLTYDIIKKLYDDAPTLDVFNSFISNKELLHNELNKIIRTCTIECEETGTEEKLNLAKE